VRWRTWRTGRTKFNPEASRRTRRSPAQPWCVSHLWLLTWVNDSTADPDTFQRPALPVVAHHAQLYGGLGRNIVRACGKLSQLAGDADPHPHAREGRLLVRPAQ
jgi:hypothetical protein